MDHLTVSNEHKIGRPPPRAGHSEPAIADSAIGGVGGGIVVGAVKGAIDVSVIVPAHNAEATLPAQLAALSAQRYSGRWEIIVVDNRSVDATSAVALSWQRRIERLRVVSAPWHRGPGHSRNVGARAARGRCLLFCDADDVVAEDWVGAMAGGLQTFDLVGGVVDRGKLNSVSSRECRPSTGQCLLDGFRYLPYVSSASMGIRRDLWARIGGFNERFVAGDDIDLCWRAQLAGGRVGIAAGAVVHYRLRRTLPATMRQLFRYGYGHVRLYRQYARLGMPPSRHTAYDPVGAWRRIIRLAARAWSRPKRMTLCADVAFRAGRLAGSIRHRVRYL